MPLSISEIRELFATDKVEEKKVKDHFWEVGENYFIRTLTYYYTGCLVYVCESDVILKDVAWIASTGRFSDALKTGEFDEVEPYPDGEVCVNRLSIVDACVWSHPLPREVQ